MQIVTLYDNTVTNDKMLSKNTLNHSHRITNLQQSTKPRKMQFVIFSLAVPVFKPGNPQGGQLEPKEVMVSFSPIFHRSTF